MLIIRVISLYWMKKTQIPPKFDGEFCILFH